MKRFIGVFFKVLLGVWWLILGITLTVLTFSCNKAIFVLLCLVGSSVWVALLITFVWYIEEKDTVK